MYIYMTVYNKEIKASVHIVKVLYVSGSMLKSYVASNMRIE